MDDLSDSEQVYATIYFMWGGDASDSELTLHNRTYQDALKAAGAYGWWRTYHSGILSRSKVPLNLQKSAAIGYRDWETDRKSVV